jgi:toxin YhaV
VQSTHWLRAKFFQQYRLFFRYHRDSRIIVYARVNDADTKRAYESATDAYQVFRRMLKRGRPPDDWNALLAEAKTTATRFSKTARKAR